MAVTISDVYTKVKDYSRNQNLTFARALGSINSATAYVMNQIGIPGHEKEYLFDFLETNQVYSLPMGFSEPISLRYNDITLNRRRNWKYKPIELLYKRQDTIGVDTQLFGIYNAKGLWQIYVLGLNSIASYQLDSFDYDNPTNWIASNDTINVRDDPYIMMEGSGSLAFDVDVTLSGLNRATITRSNIMTQDFTSYIDVGHFVCDFYAPTVTNLSSVSFSWKSDAGNYYKQTVTTQQDGSAFVVGWNVLDFPWIGSTQVGVPVITAITIYQFDVDYAAGFVDVNNFRFDDLNLVVPDKVILTYYTSYKGVDSVGTPVYNFTTLTDKFYFGDFDPSIVELIAIHAAVILNPQILVDNKELKELYKDFQITFSRKYPRKRVVNLLMEPDTTVTNSNITN